MALDSRRPGRKTTGRMMVELPAAGRDVQAPHVREVTLALPSRIVDLWEHHFTLRSRSHPPLLELQGSQLASLEPSRVLAAQMLEHRLRYGDEESRFAAQHILKRFAEIIREERREKRQKKGGR